MHLALNTCFQALLSRCPSKSHAELKKPTCRADRLAYDIKNHESDSKAVLLTVFRCHTQFDLRSAA